MMHKLNGQVIFMLIPIGNIEETTVSCSYKESSKNSFGLCRFERRLPKEIIGEMKSREMRWAVEHFKWYCSECMWMGTDDFCLQHHSKISPIGWGYFSMM